VDYHGHHG